MEKLDRRVHLEIGSRLENVELVQVAVESALQQLEIEESACQRIGSAVREATANAIKHGNAMDPDKLVQVDFALEGDQVVIRVRDEGEGFDPEKVRDPLAAENLLRPNGRGLLIMREFMDSIDFRFEPERGTELTMRKRVEHPRKAEDQQQEEKNR